MVLFDRILVVLVASFASSFAFSGNMTYFHQGLGACGKTHYDTNAVVALSAYDYGTEDNPNHAAVCGRWIKITAKGRTTRAQVWDKCPGIECPSGSIDVSPSVFQDIADLSVGRLEVTWDFEDNPVVGGVSSVTHPTSTIIGAHIVTHYATTTVTITAQPGKRSL